MSVRFIWSCSNCLCVDMLYQNPFYHPYHPHFATIPLLSASPSSVSPSVRQSKRPRVKSQRLLESESSTPVFRSGPVSSPKSMDEEEEEEPEEHFRDVFLTSTQARDRNKKLQKLGFRLIAMPHSDVPIVYQQSEFGHHEKRNRKQSSRVQAEIPLTPPRSPSTKKSSKKGDKKSAKKGKMSAAAAAAAAEYAPPSTPVLPKKAPSARLKARASMGVVAPSPAAVPVSQPITPDPNAMAFQNSVLQRIEQRAQEAMSRAEQAERRAREAEEKMQRVMLLQRKMELLKQQQQSQLHQKAQASSYSPDYEMSTPRSRKAGGAAKPKKPKSSKKKKSQDDAYSPNSPSYPGPPLPFSPQPLTPSIWDEPPGSVRRPRRPVKTPKHLEHMNVPSIKLSEPLRRCRDIVNQMMSQKFSYIFNEPVDWVKLALPDYPLVVKNPMDLSTIRTKLLEGFYDSVEAFQADVELVWANAMLFNPPGSDVHLRAMEFRDHFGPKIQNVALGGSGAVGSSVMPVAGVRKRSGGGSASSTPRPPSKPRRPSYVDDDEPYIEEHDAYAVRTPQPRPQSLNKIPLSLHEKQALKNDIFKLPEDSLGPVVQIIKQSNPDAGETEDEEIEIDIDALPIPTLRELQRYVKDALSAAQNQQILQQQPPIPAIPSSSPQMPMHSQPPMQAPHQEPSAPPPYAVPSAPTSPAAQPMQPQQPGQVALPPASSPGLGTNLSPPRLEIPGTPPVVPGHPHPPRHPVGMKQPVGTPSLSAVKEEDSSSDDSDSDSSSDDSDSDSDDDKPKKVKTKVEVPTPPTAPTAGYSPMAPQPVASQPAPIANITQAIPPQPQAQAQVQPSVEATSAWASFPASAPVPAAPQWPDQETKQNASHVAGKMSADAQAPVEGQRPMEA